MEIWSSQLVSSFLRSVRMSLTWRRTGNHAGNHAAHSKTQGYTHTLLREAAWESRCSLRTSFSELLISCVTLSSSFIRETSMLYRDRFVHGFSDGSACSVRRPRNTAYMGRRTRTNLTIGSSKFTLGYHHSIALDLPADAVTVVLIRGMLFYLYAVPVSLTL